MGRVDASANIIAVLDKLDKENFISTLKDYARYVDLCLTDIVRQINGSIDVQENLRISLQTVEFDSSDADKVVAHGLGRVPGGYIVSGRSVDLTIYDGGGLTDTTNISLRSSAVGTAKILFF